MLRRGGSTKTFKSTMHSRSHRNHHLQNGNAERHARIDDMNSVSHELSPVSSMSYRETVHKTNANITQDCEDCETTPCNGNVTVNAECEDGERTPCLNNNQTHAFAKFEATLDSIDEKTWEISKRRYKEITIGRLGETSDKSVWSTCDAELMCNSIIYYSTVNEKVVQ